MTEKIPIPSQEQISQWLTNIHANEITGLEPLSGGFWSSAFGYKVGTQEYVLRFSEMAEGYAIDSAAMRFKNPNLPIPTVLETGEAHGLSYAISERHFGRFIETADADEGENVGQSLEQLLASLRGASTTNKADGVVWYEPDSTLTWHKWLMGGLEDNPNNHVSGWKAKLVQYPEVNDLFNTCERRIQELLPYCPERRDLIHGDLLHQNVLVSEDASKVTAVFSWKCSVLGDFLFDVAWCTFWRDWHPGIAASNIFDRTLDAPDLSQAELDNAALRHHCYELQIGTSHLGWNVWVDNRDDLEAVAAVLKKTLEAGA